MNTSIVSPARMRYSMFVHYVQNYRQTPHRCCCRLLAALHCSIISKSRQILMMCAVSILVGTPRIAVDSSAGTVFTKTSSIQSTYPYLFTVLLYSDTVRCPGDNSIRLGRTDALRQNSTTTNARRMSYRYTGFMLYQALCGVQR